MRVFYDTEFYNDGRTIDLISIGLVAEDGRELYLISTGFDLRRYDENTETARWLKANVAPFLPVVRPPSGWEWNPEHKEYDDHVWNRHQIRDQIQEFLEVGPGHVELWANYAAYDHVALTQLWGDMNQMPRVLPWYTNDLQQMLRSNVVNPSSMPHQPEATRHRAIDDAWHLKACYDKATQLMMRRRYGPDAS